MQILDKVPMSTPLCLAALGVVGLNAAAVLGGRNNLASSAQSVVAGGLTNTASGTRSFVGGGQSNVASGSRSAVLGGIGNEAPGVGEHVP